ALNLLGTILGGLRKFLEVGAAVFQVLEFFHDFIDEVEYIWRGRIRLISYLYAWSRYLPLILQIVNLVFSEMVYATPSYRMCMASNILKGASAQLTGTCVEAIQMIRVHALYNCSYRSGKVLLWVFVVGTTLEVLGTVAVIGHVKPGVSGSLCVPAHCSMWSLSLFLAIYNSVGWGLIQGVLLFMTVSKIVLFRSTNCIRTPIISLMLRDGISFFVIITVVITSIVGFEVVRGLNETVFVWNVAFS
ncbi:hypothetical protein CVT25_014868, partial [Psilocybe cyanescens]